jgi:uncharacterized BrkB/YihY/UPF0761 family membrane protein
VAKKKKSKNRDTKQPRAVAVESSASLFFTVGWSISVLVTLAFLVTASLGELILGHRPPGDTAAAFVQLLRWSGVVTALVSLSLIPVVYRVRPTRPPTGFLVFAVVVAALAILSALR